MHEEDEVFKIVLIKVLDALFDDTRVKILNILRDNEMVSFRSLSRRLGINHKKLKRNINLLVKAGLVEEVQIMVSDGRIYRAYRLGKDINKVLRSK